MSNALQFFNDPRMILGLDENRLALEKAKFKSEAPSYMKDWLDTLIRNTIFTRGNATYLDLASGLETWREWRHYIWILHRSCTVENKLTCRAADEDGGFHDRFDLTIVFGGSSLPMVDNDVLEFKPSDR